METEFQPHPEFPPEPRLRDLPVTFWTLARWPLLALIRFYQMTVARGIPEGTCRFYPTCSHYGYQAIYKYGMLKGGLMAAWRVIRCNPLIPEALTLCLERPAYGWMKLKATFLSMKLKLLILLPILLLAAGLLSACGGSSYYTPTNWPGLAVDETTAYVAFNQHVYAVDLNTGAEKWRFPSKAENKMTFYSDPVLTPDGQLLVASYNHFLYSLNPATGTQNWVFEQAKNLLVASPLVTENGIFITSTDGSLYALDFKGKALWNFKTGAAIWSQPVTDGACNCVFVASLDHYVYSVDINTGQKIWQSEDLNGALVGTPAYSESDHMLYIGTFDQELLALDAGNGQVRWRFATEAWVWSGPAIADGVLYFGDQQGNFYALNSTTGEDLWSIQPQPGSPIVTTPLIAGDQIYFSSTAGQVYAVNNQGGVTWEQVISGKLYARPIVAGELVLVTPMENDALLIALQQSGAQARSFTQK
jgi:putative membrane protein insertion efficiency factor